MIEKKCKNIIGYIFYVNIKYLLVCLFFVLEEICIFEWGLYSFVYLCVVDNCGIRLECVVKKMLVLIELDLYL